jgi:lipopolysaccharide export system protein LptC
MMANQTFSTIVDFLYDLGLRLIPLVLMGLLTLASFWFLKKNTQEDPILPPRVKLHEPDYIFTNAKLTVLNIDGTTKYRLLGKEFKHYEDNAAIDIQQPRLRLFNPKTPPSTIAANTGHVTGDLDIVELFQNADVSRPAELSPKGFIINPHLHLQSTYLKIFVNEDRIITHLPIRIERGNSVMTASKGATYDNVDQAVSMFGNVQGSIEASDTSKKLAP